MKSYDFGNLVYYALLGNAESDYTNIAKIHELYLPSFAHCIAKELCISQDSELATSYLKF